MGLTTGREGLAAACPGPHPPALRPRPAPARAPHLPAASTWPQAAARATPAPAVTPGPVVPPASFRGQIPGFVPP